MQLRLPVRIFPELACPRQHLVDEFLPRRLLGRECSQDAQQLPLVLRIHTLGCFVEHIDQVASQITARASLPRFQQRERAFVEDVDGGVPVLRLHIAGGDDAELLVGFVVGTFNYSERRSGQ